ncbi:MAG: hypothetical protein ACM3SX_02500 [Deltaproteobacteria bacterium]
MVRLGARAMEALNLRVEPRLERLVDAGPIDAAVFVGGGDGGNNLQLG